MPTTDRKTRLGSARECGRSRQRSRESEAELSAIALLCLLFAWPPEEEAGGCSGDKATDEGGAA